MLDMLDRLSQHPTPNTQHQTTNKHFEPIEPLKPFEQNALKTQRPFQETLLRRKFREFVVSPTKHNQSPPWGI
jgi:hypothetical protein